MKKIILGSLLFILMSPVLYAECGKIKDEPELLNPIQMKYKMIIEERVEKYVTKRFTITNHASGKIYRNTMYIIFDENKVTFLCALKLIVIGGPYTIEEE
jgi:hypothetical protein